MPAVGRVDITAADAVGTAPITSIELSDNGGDPTADDLHNIAAMALANDALQTTNSALKVAKAGDTMTGKLTISPSTAVQGLQVSAGAASDQNAIQATGNGIGPAIIGTGGVNAAGASFTAGGGNNFGIRGIGAGTGEGVRGQGGAAGVGGTFLAGGGNNAGVSASGAGTGAGIAATGGTTGPGVTAVNGTAQTNTAPTCAMQAAGYVQLTGTDPDAGVDPGANNAVHGASVTKARGRLVVSGSPPYTFADNYNFATTSTVPGAGTHRVTMIRAMADTNYSVFVNVHGDVGYSASETNIAGRTTSAFEVTVFATDTLTPGVGTITCIDIRVEGRQ